MGLAQLLRIVSASTEAVPLRLQEFTLDSLRRSAMLFDGANAHGFELGGACFAQDGLPIFVTCVAQDVNGIRGKIDLHFASEGLESVTRLMG